MPNNYPRYVRSLKNSLFYERSWPSRLKHLGRPRFTHPLRLKLGQYTDAELHRAYAAANDEFDLQLKLMENSGSTAFTETEIEKAATALLRKQRLNAGDFEHDDDFHHMLSSSCRALTMRLMATLIENALLKNRLK